MIRRFFDLSSGHLTPETWTWLDANFADEDLRDPGNHVASAVAGGRTRYGWFVYAAQSPGIDLPKDLAQVCNEARKHRAEYVMLNCDAPPHPTLPIRPPDFQDER